MLREFGTEPDDDVEVRVLDSSAEVRYLGLPERRAFALAVSLAEQGLLEWQEFQRQLIAAVGEAEHGDAHHPTRAYYESWLISLERLLERKQLLDE